MYFSNNRNDAFINPTLQFRLKSIWNEELFYWEQNIITSLQIINANHVG